MVHASPPCMHAEHVQKPQTAFLQGVGAAFSYVAGYALLMKVVPSESLNKYMALFEALAGLGFMLGPLAGAVLYSIGR